MSTKRIPLLLLLLFVWCGLGSRTESATRLGLHVTQEELNIWRARMTDNVNGIGGYTYQAIYQNRLLADANTFVAQSHPGGDGHWNGYTGAGCAPTDQSVSPGGANGALLLRTAFVFLLTGNNTYGNPVGTDAGQTYGLQWREPGVVRMSITTGGSATNATTATTIAKQTWHSVVGVWNATDIRVYINGTLDVTPPAKTGTLTDSGNELRMGVGMNASNIFFAGLLDDVRIWSRALSAADASEYHSNTQACGASAAASPRRPVILHRFKERESWYAALVPAALRPVFLVQ